MGNKIRASAVLAAVLTFTTACGGPGTQEGAEGGADPTSEPIGSDTVPFTITTMAGLTTNSAIAVGVEKGLFEVEGLDVEIIEVESPPAAIAAVQGGTADVAYAPIPTSLVVISEGIDLQVVAAADGYRDDGEGAEDMDDTAVFVHPDSGIQSPKQLEGKKIAVPSRNGMMEIAIAAAIQKAGGDASTVEWLVLDMQSQVTSLAQGRIDAAGLAAPFTDKAESEGMDLLVRPQYGLFEHGAVDLWVTVGDEGGADADRLEAFQRGVAASNEYANANRTEIQQRVVEDQQLKDVDPDAIVLTYFPTSVHADDLQRANDVMVEIGYLPEPVDIEAHLFQGTN